MKQFNFIPIVTRQLYLIKKTWLIATIYASIVLFALLLISKPIDESIKSGTFDLLADIGGVNGSTNHFMLMFVAIPVTVTILTALIKNIESAKIALSLGSRFRIYHALVFSALGFSLIFTIFIFLFSFLCGSLFVGFENAWLMPEGRISNLLRDSDKFQAIIPNLETYKVVLTLVITKFLSFIMLSFCVLFLYQLVKKSSVIMIILLILAGIDQTGVLGFPIFTWFGTLNIYNWLAPMTTVYHSVFLIALSLILYVVTGWLYERKDFI